MVFVTEFWTRLGARLTQPVSGPPRAVNAVIRDGFFCGVWAEKSELNVPGAFFAAVTDTLCEGQALAPANVAFTDSWQEFVWRQPRDEAEIDAVIEAARADCCGGYGRNGNDHWTPDLVAAWWEGRHARRPLTELAVANLREYAPDRADEYWEYATVGAESDLVWYADWLARSLG
jgi:hypothetical protein